MQCCINDFYTAVQCCMNSVIKSLTSTPETTVALYQYGNYLNLWSFCFVGIGILDFFFLSRFHTQQVVNKELEHMTLRSRLELRSRVQGLNNPAIQHPPPCPHLEQFDPITFFFTLVPVRFKPIFVPNVLISFNLGAEGIKFFFFD